MRFLAILIAAVAFAGVSPAADPVDYLREVKPILAGRCTACHGALQQKRGLRLDTAGLIRKGGKSGPAIVPGKSSESLLIDAVTGNGRPRMPPETEGAALTAQQIATLRRWIDEGAKAPEEPIPPDPRRHWAYQTPARPAIPQVADREWAANPIDAFVSAERTKHGLAPRPPASRETLLRRLYLDLIGLPPTREELSAFLADRSPNAYEKVVDRLLASPRYGERWGRHWLDVWRYSDWYGRREVNEIRNSTRHIWRWRDWTIESINQDKGYDRMILEMLAGDELAPGDNEIARATGYLGRSYYIFNRTVWLQDTVEYLGASFLGMTLKCCRCHDHKYDPITQEEYYRLRAFFEPHQVRTDRLPGKSETAQEIRLAMAATTLKEGFDRVYDADLQCPTYLLERGDEKRPRKDHPLTPGVPRVVERTALDLQPVPLPRDVYYPELRMFRQQEMLADAHRAVQQAETACVKSGGLLAKKTLAAASAKEAALVAALAAEKARTSEPAEPHAYDLAHTAAKAQAEAALKQAELEEQQALEQVEAAKKAAKPDDAKAKTSLAAAEKNLAGARDRLKVARANLEKPKPLDHPFGPVYPAVSSGRRLALARWIASRDNPLTARVAVNHMWLRHFGAALVPTVANFGLNGKKPTHPELLDWLAIELMDSGWSMKHLHRLMVTSKTYRMDSAPAGADDPNLARDPENTYLWRMNYRRMESEVVRDSLLYLTGRLDFAPGGPDLDPTTADKMPRRSLYFRHTPDDEALFLQMFDAPNPAECFKRTESIIPQQALALANGGLCLSQSRVLATSLAKAATDDRAFIQQAFETVLSRAPTEAELARCGRFLQQQAVSYGAPATLKPFAGGENVQPGPSADPRQRARENLVHVLFNHNDFVTIR